jgi:hypothetical protein
MKTTYTGTMFHPDVTTAKVELYISKVNKYDRGGRIYVAGEEPEDEEKVILPPVKSWAIVEGGTEADAVETIMDEVEENREYLIINFADGKTEIYRNSHVTMFIF